MQYTCNAALHVYYCSYYEEPQLLPQEDGVDKKEHIVSAGQGNRVGLNGSDAGGCMGASMHSQKVWVLAGSLNFRIGPGLTLI